MALLPSKNKIAWKNFTAFFNYPSLGKALPQKSRSYQDTPLNAFTPPCVPPSAFETAPLWVNTRQDEFYLLKSWWLRAPKLIWNGNYCMEPHLFSSQEKRQFKAKLQSLDLQKSYSTRRKITSYLKALEK